MKIFEAIKQWYYTKVQTHLGSILITLSLIDMTSYEKDITAFIGAKGYSGLKIAILCVMVYRASQVRAANKPGS